MIADIAYEDRRRLSADVCIIGSGAAGLTLAVELERTSLRTLVLESGGTRFDARTQALYDCDSVGLAHGFLLRPRYRGFGGTTTRWAGQVLPLGELDFAARQWVADSGWPFGRDELDPYYERACRALGLPGFPRLGDDSWPEALSPPPFDRRLLEPVFSMHARRRDLGRVHRQTLAASRNVTVLLGANVTELVPDAATTFVQAARARSLDGRELEIRADLFVVCCGGIETARLLLASDRRCDGGLGNEHDLVGRYFQDHPCVVVGAAPGRARALNRGLVEPHTLGGVKYRVRTGLGADRQREEQLLNAGGTCFPPSHPSVEAARMLYRAAHWPELRGERPAAWRALAHKPLPVVAEALRHGVERLPLGAAAREALLARLGSPGLMLCVQCEQAPNRDSRVYLSTKRDELGMRRTVLDWRVTDKEIKTLRRFAEVAALELERTDVAHIDPETLHLPDDPEALSHHIVDSYHHMGTTRMAQTPHAGVVDPDCKVFGLDNLYVGSAAVFPTGGFANPTLTLMALCLRLADTLQARSAAAATAELAAVSSAV